MYREHLPLWLDTFGCSNIHLLDSSVDGFEEVKRLFEFVGVPDVKTAYNVTVNRVKNGMLDDSERETSLPQ